jgi:hypothetical protein
MIDNATSTAPDSPATNNPCHAPMAAINIGAPMTTTPSPINGKIEHHLILGKVTTVVLLPLVRSVRKSMLIMVTKNALETNPKAKLTMTATMVICPEPRKAITATEMTFIGILR